MLWARQFESNTHMSLIFGERCCLSFTDEEIETIKTKLFKIPLPPACKGLTTSKLGSSPSSCDVFPTTHSPRHL